MTFLYITVTNSCLFIKVVKKWRRREGSINYLYNFRPKKGPKPINLNSSHKNCLKKINGNQNSP